MTPTDFIACASAVADPTRLRMLVALRRGPLCVGELAATVGISSSATTYHTKLMRAAGLVIANGEGRRTVVRRVEQRWQTIVGALATDES